MECAGRHRRISLPALLCIYLIITAFISTLNGCAKAPDILSQEPVIPLTDIPHEKEEPKEDPGTGREEVKYPEIHVSGDAVNKDNDKRDKTKADKKDNSGTDEEKADDNDSNAGKDDKGNDYQVEGVQLSEEQLENRLS